MTELVNLQSLFQSYVINGDDAAVPAFVGNASASAEERLDVYYEAYRLRLLEVLREDFPGLIALMSTDTFNAMGLRYLDKHPSYHPSVRSFGRHLTEFLTTDGIYSAWPYLAEMARFEWARGLAFDAANADVRTLDELGALPGEDWPALRVRFHPTLQRSRFAWNIGPIWRAVDAEAPLPQPAMLDKPEPWAVWRRDVTVYWRSLHEVEARAMDAFADGRDFAEVCTVLCEWLDAEAVPARMAGMLNQWVTEGLVTR
jgi:hypothetical protein